MDWICLSITDITARRARKDNDMPYLKIHCSYCGGTWDVYHKQREYDAARQCPHCDARIDGATWREKILPAYNSMRAANMALLDDHVQNHCPRLEVDFVFDGTFQNADKADLANGVQHLEYMDYQLAHVRDFVNRVESAIKGDSTPASTEGEEECTPFTDVL